MKWYTKAAEHGHAEAQYRLGKKYESGLGGLEKNDAEAVKWYTKAAEQGHVNSQSYLGRMYKNGRGVEKDKAEAVRWYTKAAEQGDHEAKSYLEPIAEAAKAEQGDAEAQYQLGVRYNEGRGVEKDYAEAVKWYTKAAEQGHAQSQLQLGKIYDYAGKSYNYNNQGVEQDYAEAVRWYTKAAEQKSDLTSQTLAKNYLKAIAEAAKYLMLAEQGDANAQYQLGVRYNEGRGVGKDYAEASKWFKKAAEQGNARAQYQLGDTKIIKAAEQGDAESQYYLGVMYDEGRGMEQDEAEAVKWYTKAAEQGNDQAQYKLYKLDKALENELTWLKFLEIILSYVGFSVVVPVVVPVVVLLVALTLFLMWFYGKIKASKVDEVN